MEQKILIKENSQNATNAVARLKNYFGAVNPSFAKLEADTEYQPTLTEARSALTGNGDLIKTGIDKLLEKQMNAAKLTSKIIRDGFKSDSEEIVKTFMQKLNLVIHSSLPENFEYATMNQGQLELNAENEAKLRETFKEYLSSPESKKLHDLHIAAAEALNTYFEAINNHSHLHYFNIVGFAQHHFWIDTSEMKVFKAVDISYDNMVNLRKMLDARNVATNRSVKASL